MGHDHSHAGHSHGGHAHGAGAGKRALAFVFVPTTAFLAVASSAG